VPDLPVRLAALHGGIAWSLCDPAAGVIDATGTFTSSARGGTYPDLVRATIGGVTGSAAVTIVAPARPRVFIPLASRAR
jgi:hypothetical protein